MVKYSAGSKTRAERDDYYAAMSQVEKRLDLVGTQKETPEPLAEDERAQLLELASQLERPELNLDSRLKIVTQIRKVLACPGTSQNPYPLPIPIFAEAGIT